MLPAVDTASCARLLAAFYSDRWSGEKDRERANRLEGLAPGCGDLIRGTRAWHQRASVWSAGLGCCGGVVCGAGYPAAPETHRSAGGQVLPGRWVLADPDEGVTIANQWGPEQDPSRRVQAIRGSGIDPEDILGRPEVRAAGGPLSAHWQMGAQFWPGPAVEEAVAGWARMLPAGSTFTLSLWLADEASPVAGEFSEAFCGGLKAHTEADVRRWLDVCRLDADEFAVHSCTAGAIATAKARVG